MSSLGNPGMGRRTDSGAPLFGETPVTRRSAMHGEAGFARRPRDAYFTEAWVTRALLACVRFDPIVWEPACGDGRMAAVLGGAGYRVFASDIHNYGWPGTRRFDFLRDEPFILPAAIVTNPPFGTPAVQFIRRALQLTRPSRGKVAILQRHDFDASAGHQKLLGFPYAAKVLLPGRRPLWVDPEPGERREGPRFPFAWYVWNWDWAGPPITLIAPDERKRAVVLLEPL